MDFLARGLHIFAADGQTVTALLEFQVQEHLSIVPATVQQMLPGLHNHAWLSLPN